MLSIWPRKIKEQLDPLTQCGFVGHFVQQGNQSFDLVMAYTIFEFFVYAEAFWANLIQQFDTGFTN